MLVHSSLRTSMTVLASLSAFGMSACGGEVRSDIDPSTAALVISINRHVAIPDRVHYVTAGQNWGNALAAGVGGVIGGMVGGLIAGSGADRHLLEYFQRYNIDVGQIYADAMTRAFERDPHIVVADGGSAANRLQLEVTDYGFESSQSFGGGMKLVMNVKADLFDSTGKKIWSKGSNATHAPNRPELGIDAFMSDPVRLAAMFRAAADDMSWRLRGDLMARHLALVVRPGVSIARVGTQRSESRAVAIAYQPSTSTRPAPAITDMREPGVRVGANARSEADSIQPIAEGSQVIVARRDAGLRRQPSRSVPMFLPLAAGTALHVASRLENDSGFWWYATSEGAAGWILEADLRTP